MSGRDNKFPVSSGAMGRLMSKIKRSVSESVIIKIFNIHIRTFYLNIFFYPYQLNATSNTMFQELQLFLHIIMSHFTHSLINLTELRQWPAWNLFQIEVFAIRKTMWITSIIFQIIETNIDSRLSQQVTVLCFLLQNFAEQRLAYDSQRSKDSKPSPEF